MTLPEVLRRVVSILSEESVAYMVTGSFATAYYAHPRATQDIDLVVEASEVALERVAARLKEAGYYVSPEAVREAVEQEGQFNAIEADTGWKIDFIVRKSRPFSIAEFSRRTQWDELDRPYLNQWIVELGLGDLWDRVTEAIDVDPGDSSPA